MNQLNQQQITWAKSHDWFSHMEGDCVVVVDRWYNCNTKESGEDFIVWIKSFRELRDFAGY